MFPRLTAARRNWPLAAPFRISRGVRTSADVVVVEIAEDGRSGCGESVPSVRYGETIDSVLAQVGALADALAAGVSRDELAMQVPAGAARNAVDCALWDLRAQRSGESVASLLGEAPLPAMISALTVGIDTPEAMGRAAARISGAGLIKVKVDAEDPASRILAVREAAPGARLIVDPNESWDMALLEAMQPILEAADVALVEQPLPAAADQALLGFAPLRPICADEACHVASDLPALRGKYQAVNIKLDKTGGLTGALQLLGDARQQGFQVMVGCMVCTSLSIAPALHVARHADFVDLDGPWLLRQDRDGGVRFDNGLLLPPSASLWGEPRS